jgi:hypothetical protein
LFLEIPNNAHVKISKDESNFHLKVISDQLFILRDENALLQNLGMSKITNDDIKRVFDPSISEYLCNQKLVDVSSSEKFSLKP